MNVIHLCQPDNKKGCSVCCGLFNFRDIKRETLTAHLNNGLNNYHDDPLREDVRDITSHICRYQRFIGKGKPGCGVHPIVCGEDRRSLSLFGAKICHEFLCPAHAVLKEDEKKALISSINDWYLYSIAIIDPESLQWIFAEICAITKKGLHLLSGDEMKQAVSTALSLHSDMLGKSDLSLFHYSVQEYNSHKMEFTLGSENKNTAKQRNMIGEALRSFF